MQTLKSKPYFFDLLSDSIFDPNATDFWLQKINPTWSTYQTLGTIVSKTEVAHDMTALRIRCNRRMQYGVAGQHHPVIVEINARSYERNYSLTQIDARHVQLTVKKIPEGIVSHWLCEQAQIGDVIQFGTPYGDMTVQKAPEQLILVAAGSGITPIYSMLYDFAKTGKFAKTKVRLLYWAKQQQDFAFLTELSAWQQRFDNFEVHYFCTQAAPFDARVNPEHLALIPDLEQQTVYICGPSGFVNTANDVFAKAKVLKSEAFSFSPIISDESDVGTIEVTLSQSNKTITIAKGQPILAGLEQANIKPTHGCRMGICNKCACKKSSGQTKNLQDGTVNHEINQDLRICVNTAQSDLILDL